MSGALGWRADVFEALVITTRDSAARDLD